MTLVAGDVRLPCHRAVLAATSDYFNAIFSSDLVEATSDTVRLETDPKTMRHVVDYIYNGEVVISTDNVQNLVNTSDFFLLDKLKTACGRFLMRHLQFSNVIEFHRFARFYRLAELRRKVCQQFSEFVPSAEFSVLTGSELAELIEDDWLAVPDEDAVLEAVLRWARQDFKKKAVGLSGDSGTCPFLLLHKLLHVACSKARRLPHGTVSKLSGGRPGVAWSSETSRTPAGQSPRDSIARRPTGHPPRGKAYTVLHSSAPGGGRR